MELLQTFFVGRSSAAEIIATSRVLRVCYCYGWILVNLLLTMRCSNSEAERSFSINFEEQYESQGLNLVAGRHVLLWLPVQQRIHYRISSIVWHCVLGNAPSYLLGLFILTSACCGRQSLRPASKGGAFQCHVLALPPDRKGLFDRGSLVCNCLPSDLRPLPRDLSSSFYKLLKTHLFGRAWAGSASE